MRRCESPAAERNRGPILEVLRRRFAGPARVLEIGSGTGQHAAFFAAELPHLEWQPSDRDASHFESIRAWAAEAGAPRCHEPLRLDVTRDPWPAGPFDGVFAANVIHIAPFEVCLAILDGAAACLAPGGALVFYGPFRIGGQHTAPSNDAFDRDLRARDPRWGVRELEAVEAEASARELELSERVPMPANNQILIFELRPRSRP